MLPIAAISALATAISVSPSAAAHESADRRIHAQVIQIVDGDSLTVAIDGEMVRVRLAGIDAPEGRQPYTTRSKKSLSELCFWIKAELSSITKDQYGRTVATVQCNGLDASREQVRRGMAWVRAGHADDPELQRLQEEARAAGQGLWASTQPVPPWQWNKERERR